MFRKTSQIIFFLLDFDRVFPLGLVFRQKVFLKSFICQWQRMILDQWIALVCCFSDKIDFFVSFDSHMTGYPVRRLLICLPSLSNEFDLCLIFIHQVTYEKKLIYNMKTHQTWYRRRILMHRWEWLKSIDSNSIKQ